MGAPADLDTQQRLCLEFVRDVQIDASWPTNEAVEFPHDPRTDFGRVVFRDPRVVMRPNTRAQVAAVLRFVVAAGIPVSVRGRAHSSGGQALSAGVVLDLSRLARIHARLGDSITAEGGAGWTQVVARLSGAQRRPVVLTDNWETTVAGTLAVGGIGDTSHRSGLQIDHVTGLTIMTLDGTEHATREGDDLFEYTLGALAPLGVILDATLTTTKGPPWLDVRELHFASLPDFLEYAAAGEASQFGYFRARARWHRGFPIKALAGQFVEAPAIADASQPAPGEPWLIPQAALCAGPPPASWSLPCPALEFALPAANATQTVTAIFDQLVRAGVHLCMPRGPSVAWVAGANPTRKMTPLPDDAGAAVFVALRPEVPRHELPRLLPVLARVEQQVVDAGGRFYFMSHLSSDARWFSNREAQRSVLGPLKSRYDPGGLLGPMGRWLASG